MDINEQIKLLEEQVGGISDLRNLNHRDSRFITWKKKTLSHLENIFSEGSEYVRRFETLTFQEPGFGATGGSGISYEDMGGSFVHDLDRAKTILEDGIEALRRLRPPKPKAKTIPKETAPEKPPSEEPVSDDLFFERAILEKTLSEGPADETIPGEDLSSVEEILETSHEEAEPSLEEVIKGSQEASELPLEEVMKSSHEKSGPSLRNQAVDEVVGYVSSLLYHYISLEEDPQTKKALQGLRGELDNPKRSKEGIMKALKTSWEGGKDVLVDIIARVFAKKD
ncbi:MAG: hypothetical protein ACE5NJ_10335 [Thermodesulfobacteriota bacterium]